MCTVCVCINRWCRKRERERSLHMPLNTIAPSHTHTPYKYRVVPNHIHDSGLCSCSWCHQHGWANPSDVWICVANRHFVCVLRGRWQMGLLFRSGCVHLGYDELATPHPAAINTEDTKWCVLFKAPSQRSNLTIVTPKEMSKLYQAKLFLPRWW